MTERRSRPAPLLRFHAAKFHYGAVAFLNDAVIGLSVSVFAGGPKFRIAVLERQA